MTDNKTITLSIDGVDVTVPVGSTIMDAATKLDVEIPHFCYHERLSIAGNCRMCLVEVEGAPKPVASCHWPAAEGMKVFTKSSVTKEARKGVMEFLLINHPLDCPICDQGGECDLQDVALGYGSDRSRYHDMKRAVEDKDIGPLIKTVMTRCIHCTRCVRFATEIAGVEEFGGTGRGEDMKIGTYVERALVSELSGNMIDLCPVGALTSKPYAYTARPWELTRAGSIDVMDAVGSNITVDQRDGKVMRILPRENDTVNEEWIADTARFCYDGLSHNRLDTPLVRKGKKLQPVGWTDAFKAIKNGLKGAKKANIAGLSGNLLCAEDVYAFNAFMRETLGSENVDCRTNGFALTGEHRSAYTFNTPIAEVEEADLALVIGANPRLEAPLVNTRLRKAVRNGTLKQVANIGAPTDLTYPTTELGEKLDVLQEIIDGSHPFAKKLAKAKRPVVMAGIAALGRKDGEMVAAMLSQLAEKYPNVANHDWQGMNILHQHPGIIAGLDMGAYPTGKAKGTRQIIKDIKADQVDVLVLHGESNLSAADVKGARFTIYIGTHNTSMAQVADVVLPAATFTEKAGWWVNLEGRVQEGAKAVNPPLNAKEDWKIFRAISGILEKPLPFDTHVQLREQVVEKGGEAYSRIGERTDIEWKSIGHTGKLSSDKLESALVKERFFLNNEVLRHSDIMQQCYDVITGNYNKEQDVKKAS